MSGMGSVACWRQPASARGPVWRRHPRPTISAPALAALLAVVLIGPAAAQAAGTTLYVDQHNAVCSDTGSGTAAQPFCTIGAAAAKTAPGATVVVSSGTYAEEVKPPVSGAAGSPVTYTAAPGAHVVVTGAPEGSTAKPAFYISGRSWITVSGFTITTGDKGVYATGSSNLAILDNHVTGCALQGIQLNSSTASRVADNTIDQKSSAVWFNATTQSSISNNAIVRGGIHLYASHDDTLSANVIRDSIQQAISTIYSTDNLIVNNAIFNPAALTQNSVGQPVTNGYAITLLYGDQAGPCVWSGPGCVYQPYSPTSGTRILFNSIAQYEPAPAITVQGTSKTTLADNIIDVINPQGGVAVRVDSVSIAGTSLDYDVLNAPAGKLVWWNGATYASLAKFTADLGQEQHGIQAPSGFDDPANGNLSLSPGSAAVDSALSGTLNAPAGSFALPAADAFGGARVDDAATPNTGAGAISYADRGGFEMHNAGFESNIAGWNTSGSGPGVTLTQVAGGHTGNGAALVSNTGTAPATCALNDSPNIVHTTTAGTYTATLWVRADNPGATLTLRLREWAGSTAVGEASTLVTLTSQWQAVTAQYTAVDPGTSTLDFSAYEMKAAPGSCFYADDASVAVG